jgi:hypothetical protein
MNVDNQAAVDSSRAFVALVLVCVLGCVVKLQFRRAVVSGAPGSAQFAGLHATQVKFLPVGEVGVHLQCELKFLRRFCFSCRYR